MKKIIFVTLFICSFMSVKAEVTCTQYSNQTYCSDGSTYTQYGNMGLDSNGRTYTTYGNTTYISDPDTKQDYTYRQNGHSYDAYKTKRWPYNLSDE